MVQELKTDMPEHPALQGFNGGWEKFVHVAKKTLTTGLKVGVIGGLVLGTLAAVSLGPVGGVVSALVNTVGQFFGMEAVHLGTTAIFAAAKQGLLLGGIAGAAIGLAKGVGEADDVVEDMQAARISQYNKARQMAMNEQTLAMGMQKNQAFMQQMAGMQPQMPQQMPNMGQGMGQGRPMG